ncbi:uncharacterized protein C8R40DRAFT_1240464 [Lentinula edodes]|uniref:uncharacterized protein n=1 Tax=Lentinula edodes TaxID=5353 RepID=UPI001E8CB4C6|nr:uncharacterized protein C8R40DRAFT_1240464 [Lentinula edodes]KAH7870413.1 hypothetical protein C8R40DRAFT_1240464 [Lentinula edodes]
MSSLTSTPSTPSLDALSDFDHSLLSESLSLDTISILSLDSIPPFPSGCRTPLPTFLTINDITCASANLQPNTLSTSTTTIPTPPRLKTLLKEDLCISRWTESLAFAEAPGHTPWGDVEDHDITPWKPEGSLYAGDTFQMALLKSRQRPSMLRLARQRLPVPNSHHRNALVFEREITLKSEGKTKRWSVQVPAGSMDPDLAGMMMELRNLNSYFKEEEVQADDSVQRLEEGLCSPVDGVYTHTPSLIVSNSQCIIPLSLESAGSLHTVPKILAVRRGNKALPPLSIKSELMNPSPYPSIPTAFLGSPSSYHPTFEFAGTTRSSTAFQDMIESLRSQCASLQVETAHFPALQEEENNFQMIQSCPHVPPASPSARDGDNDWAFADSLLQEFPEFCSKQNLEPPNVELQSDKIFPEASITDPAQLTHTISSNDPSNSHLPSPSIAGSVSPTPSSNSPRGILKRCKSVRFAEAPLIDPDSVHTTPVQEVVCPSTRHSTGPPIARSLKRPSPLRHTYAPQLKLTSSADSSLPLRNAGSLKPTIASETTNSKPSVHLQRTAMKKLGRECIVSSPIKPNKPKTQGPPSLGRSFRNTLISGKENKLIKLRTSSFANRHTMDENALRRVGNSSSPSETLKSRMPVPLRNILTRFK